MKNEAQLMKLAVEYVEAFRAALVTGHDDYKRLVRSRNNGFSTGARGTVEFTEQLVEAGRKLSDLATLSFGPARIHAKSVEEAARSVLFDSDGELPPKTVARDVIANIAAAATKTHRVIRPNQLFRLVDGVDEVNIGPVRIVRRDLLSAEIGTTNRGVRITPQKSQSEAITVTHSNDLADTEIHLPEVCWDVTIQGMPQKIEQEALWLVDVAVSFARLQYKEYSGLFPRLKDIEPHPVRPYQWMQEGFVVSADAGLRFGGGTAPTWYEVGPALVARFSEAKTRYLAEVVFSPPSRSVAERMQQVLGWMSRARQEAEPAERVLLFFTAIEALLSSSAKDVPITETIARGASVIWSADQATRSSFYKAVKKLYDIRSKVIHNGFRSVAEVEASNVHYIIWNLSYLVIHKVDLKQSHAEFIEELKEASFGRKWNPSGVALEPEGGGVAKTAAADQ